MLSTHLISFSEVYIDSLRKIFYTLGIKFIFKSERSWTFQKFQRNDLYEENHDSLTLCQ